MAMATAAAACESLALIHSSNNNNKDMGRGGRGSGVRGDTREHRKVAASWLRCHNVASERKQIYNKPREKCVMPLGCPTSHPLSLHPLTHPALPPWWGKGALCFSALAHKMNLSWKVVNILWRKGGSERGEEGRKWKWQNGRDANRRAVQSCRVGGAAAVARRGELAKSCVWISLI